MSYNPYYDSDKLGWKQISLVSSEAYQDYGFDILCFWLTQDGVVYAASDSGCSCPSPFEDYSFDEEGPPCGKTPLEKVANYEQALSMIKSWNAQEYSFKDKTKKASASLVSNAQRRLKKWFEGIK